MLLLPVEWTSLEVTCRLLNCLCCCTCLIVDDLEIKTIVLFCCAFVEVMDHTSKGGEITVFFDIYATCVNETLARFEPNTPET